MIDRLLQDGAPVELSHALPPKGYDQIVDFLREQMRLGRLKAGDRLLPERELALRLNISRPILREALRSLAMIGVLEIQQGRGTFVRAPDFSALGHLFTFMFVQNGDELDDIMELRQAIERQAIRLACLRARPRDLEKIGEAMARIRATIDDPAAGGEADFDFHRSIVDASHSSALKNVYAIVSTILRDNHVQRRRRIALGDRLHEFIVEHHAQLLDAIRRRNADECDRLLTLHFDIGAELAAGGDACAGTVA